MPMIMTLIIALSSLFALQAKPSVSGTWTAQHAGQTFVRLELTENGSSVSGRISLGDMEVDKSGNVRKAAAAPAAMKPIFDVAMKGNILTFSSRDSNDPDRWEMKIVDATTAELTLKLSDDALEELKADGIPAPRPIRLTKQAR